MANNNNQWGGERAGAGRPRSNDPKKVVAVRLESRDIAQMDKFLPYFKNRAEIIEQLIRNHLTDDVLKTL